MRDDKPMSTSKVVLLSILGILLVAGISVGCWFGYWALNRKAITNQYNNNVNNQQYQSSLIAQERDTVAGYHAATDPSQRAYLKNTFCTMYVNLNPPTADLVAAHAEIC